MPLARGVEEGVPDRGRDGDDRRLAGARRGEVAAVEQDDVDRRRVVEARDAVAREARVQDHAVLEADRLEERAAQPHHERALDLVLEPGGIDDGPALEGRDDRSEEHTSELQSLRQLVCRLLLEKTKNESALATVPT